MFKILQREELNSTVTKLVIEAPLIASKAQAGQFVIVRARELGERIPLTIADFDRELGTISIIFQIVGKTTMILNTLDVNQDILDVVGPLGRASNVSCQKRVCVVGGGVGCAIAYPVAKAFSKNGTDVTVITGFRNKDLVILADEFKTISNSMFMVSDDGSIGEKGLVTNKLEDLLCKGEVYDEVIAIGPLAMMKYVSLVTKKYNVKTTVSMNPIMIDGTGMCGCCRLSVDKEVKFACVDGPDFDGHKVDFDEAISRSKQYLHFETQARDENCNLFSKKEA